MATGTAHTTGLTPFLCPVCLPGVGGREPKDTNTRVMNDVMNDGHRLYPHNWLSLVCFPNLGGRDPKDKNTSHKSNEQGVKWF